MHKRNALILMTALPPTRGHQYLIDFALDWASSPGANIGQVEVLLCTRECEPLSGYGRYDALWQQFGNRGVRIVHFDGDPPQEPDDHPDFWSIWRDIIRRYTLNRPGDVIFASERYGIELAGTLECEFVPCNIYREVVHISGTRVREDPISNFAYIMPAYQSRLRRTITIFGAESTGKTTLARALARELPGHFVPEWAREYLQTCGAELSDAKMLAIARGQYAAQVAAGRQLDKPFVIQDTDLLSTIGYYRIYGKPTPQWLGDLFRRTKANLYILTNSKIPFVPDQLRYGGDKRESTDQFWADLLDEFGCEYRTLQQVMHFDRINEAADFCEGDFWAHAGFEGFSRLPLKVAA